MFPGSPNWDWKLINVFCRQRQTSLPKWIDTKRGTMSSPSLSWSYEWHDRPIVSSFEQGFYFFCSGSENELPMCQCEVCESATFLKAQCHSPSTSELTLHLVRKDRYFNEGTLVTYVKDKWGPICIKIPVTSSIFCHMFGREPQFAEVDHNRLRFVYSYPVVNVLSCKENAKSISQCDIDKDMVNAGSYCNSSFYAYIKCGRKN